MSATTDVSRPRRDRFALAVFAALFLVVYFPTMRWLVHRWSMGVWYHTHGFAIPVIAAWLAIGPLRSLKDRAPDASAWGYAFVVPALLLLVLDSVMGFELVAAISLVLLLPGLSLLLLGRARTRAIWFPLFFMAFAIPVPLVIAEKIHWVLRILAARGTEWALGVVGFDVTRDVTRLSFDSVSIQIADACSGFATLSALFAFGMLIAYTSTSRLWKGGLLLALVFPFAIFANILRCLVLAVLVAGQGPDVLKGWIHPGSGVAAFVVALLLMLLVVEIIEPEPEPEAAS